MDNMELYDKVYLGNSTDTEWIVCRIEDNGMIKIVCDGKLTFVKQRDLTLI